MLIVLKKLCFFQNVEQKNRKKKQICAIFFQFKLGHKAAETARDINQAFGIEPLLNAQHSGDLRNFVPVMKILKMM